MSKDDQNRPKPDAPNSALRMSLLLLRLCLSLLMLGLFLRFYSQRSTQQPPPFPAAERAIKAGNLTAARAVFDQEIRKRPHDPNLFEEILTTCKSQKQWGLAIEYALRAVTACKDESPALQAGLSLELSGLYAEVEPAHQQTKALEAAKRAVDLDPKDPTCLNGYGYALADNATGKGPEVDQALKLLREALITQQQNSPPFTDPEARQMLLAMTEDSYGWALYKNEDYPQAVTTLSMAIQDYTEDVPVDAFKISYYHLGMAYIRTGEIASARNAFKSALVYDPNDADSKSALSALPPEVAAAPPPGSPPDAAQPPAAMGNATSSAPSPAPLDQKK